jgi:hypothetical protein
VTAIAEQWPDQLESVQIPDQSSAAYAWITNEIVGTKDTLTCDEQQHHDKAN